MFDILSSYTLMRQQGGPKSSSAPRGVPGHTIQRMNENEDVFRVSGAPFPCNIYQYKRDGRPRNYL